MSAKDPFSILYRDTNNKQLKASEEKAKKVERYRPGKVPDWEEPEPSLPGRSIPVFKSIEIEEIRAKSSSLDPDCESPAVSSTSLDLHRSAPKPTSTSTPTAEATSSSSSKFLLRENISDPSNPSNPSNPSTAPLSSLDFKSPSESSIRNKPVFVRKSNRSTHLEREVKEKQEQELLEELKSLQDEKKTRTKVVVAEAILKEEIQQFDSDPETSSSSEDEEAFSQWKIREIKRIMRDKEARELRLKEEAEIERRRLMSDWERQEEDKKLGNDALAKPVKQKIQFMQKYYNKGVYFQERDQNGKLQELFMRDYNAPVEGDFDKTNMPKILQKRRGEFGKKGQSKYTHLTNEDTTDFNPMFMPQPELLMKQQMKGAGYKAMNLFDAKVKK